MSVIRVASSTGLLVDYWLPGVAHFESAFGPIAFMLGLDVSVQSRVGQVGFPAAADIVPALLVLAGPSAQALEFFLVIQLLRGHL